MRRAASGAMSLRLGTTIEDRPRYTPATTFETFPWPLDTPELVREEPDVLPSLPARACWRSTSCVAAGRPR